MTTTSSTPQGRNDSSAWSAMSVRGERVGIGHQNACDVERDVAVTDDNRPGAGQIGRYLLEVRMSVVPADEIDRRDAAGQLFAGDVQRPIRLRADRVDHRVVVLGKFGRADVLAHRDVAEEAEPRVLGGLLELLADRLDLGVVGRDPGAHQTPRRRQHLQHVDGDVDVVVRVGCFEQRRRGEESRGTRADDRDVERTHKSPMLNALPGRRGESSVPPSVTPPVT